MKRLLSLLLIAAMLLTLAACAAGETTAEPAATTETTTEPAAQETEAPADASSDAEPVTIEYWYQNAYYDDWINKMVEDFHTENPDVTVVPVLHGDDQALTTALTAAFQEGKAPTLFHTRANNSLASYATEGVLQDLSGYGFDASETEAGLAGGSVDGKLYAACLGYSAFCVIYNQDIFDELQLTSPTTFDELVNVVKTCQDAGYGGIAYPGSTAGHVWLSRGLFRDAMTVDGYNAFELGIDNGTVTDLYEYPEAVDAIRSMSAYCSNGLLYNGSDAMDTDAEISLFATGECAMMVNYTGVMLSAEALVDMNLGIFPLLGQTGSGKYYAEINNMISMYSGASDAEKEAGARFISFLLREDNMTYYASTRTEVPAVNGIVADHKYGELFEREFSSRGINMRTVCVTSNSEMWKAEYDALQTGVIFNGLDPDEAIQSFNDHLQAADIASYA